MKNIEEIRTIIATMDDKLFDKINKADYDCFSNDVKERRNGKKRLIYNLKKVNLTVEEWDMWCIE